jgi:hypothetical protein
VRTAPTSRRPSCSRWCTTREVYIYIYRLSARARPAGPATLLVDIPRDSRVLRTLRTQKQVVLVTTHTHGLISALARSIEPPGDDDVCYVITSCPDRLPSWSHRDCSIKCCMHVCRQMNR